MKISKNKKKSIIFVANFAKQFARIYEICIRLCDMICPIG